MVREIMHDETFLAQKAEFATPEDLPVARDLLDTHGLLRPEVLSHLSQADAIIHGGDINTQAIVDMFAVMIAESEQFQVEKVTIPHGQK